MTLINSPKKLLRGALIFIAVIVFLLWSTNEYSDEFTLKSDTDDHLALVGEPVVTNSLNTTWDNDVNPWILPSRSTQDISFLQQLKTYTTKGHESLPSTLQPDNDVTVLLTINSKQGLSKLQAVQAWALPIQIWVVCSSSITFDTSGLTVTVLDPVEASHYVPSSAGDAVWLQVLPKITTEYVFALDHLVSKQEFLAVYSTARSDDYQGALVGTQAALFNPNGDLICLPRDFNSVVPRLSQPADMLLSSWLLKREWLPLLLVDTSIKSLELPLGYYISSSLYHFAGVPTIALPLQSITNNGQCDQVETEWHTNADWKAAVKRSQLPTALLQRQEQEDGIMVVVKDREELIRLQPLICRFKDYPVHVALLGNELNGADADAVFAVTSCQQSVRVHDFTQLENNTPLLSIDHRLARLMQTVPLRVVVQVQETTPLYHIVQFAVQSASLTDISLPIDEIHHALWIPDISLEALTNWNKIQVKLAVITDRRPHSLSRLLQSASSSYFLGDKVDIVIHMEQSADKVTRTLVNTFMWRKGQKLIRHRIRKGGLMPAIVESWYPSHNDEYAVLLEDDIEVSPLFYTWSKYAILKYRYSSDKEAYRLMYGISLYAPRNLELIPAGRLTFDPNSVLLPNGFPEQTPYSSQVPCSWGAVYFPEHWREFHTYLVMRLKDLNLPKNSQKRLISVPGSRSDKWKKSWKKYLIELVYLRGYVMLYPNFQGFEAFSTNHVEFGTHVQSGKRQSVIGTFMVPLMQRDTILSQLPNHRLPTFRELPVLDFWGQLQTIESIENTASAYHKHVSTCKRTYGTFDPQEFFCTVDGPPDPPQVFPMSPKAPKPPVLVKDAVQPIKYVYADSFATESEEEQAKSEWVAFGPKPIDVALLPSSEERHSNRDDEMADLESDLDTLNRLYYELNPVDLNAYLDSEKEDMEEEDMEEDMEDNEEEEEEEEMDEALIHENDI